MATAIFVSNRAWLDDGMRVVMAVYTVAVVVVVVVVVVVQL